MAFEWVEENETPKEQPSFGQEALRHAKRTGIRVAEMAAGAPGDIMSLVNDYISGPITSKALGTETIPYEELGISKILPTSSQLKKGHEKQFGESIKPQSKVESFFDDVVGTATSIFTPGAAIKKGVGLFKTGASSLVKSLGAHVAKEAIQDLTGSESKAAAAQMGSLILLSFIDKKGAAKAIGEGYKPLEARAAQLSPIRATALEQNLGNLKSKMMKGTQAPSEKFIVDEVNAVLDKVKDGRITPEELWASKRSLNEKLPKILYEAGYNNRPRAKKLATVITRELDEALKLTQKQDPNFYKELKQWNSAYKALADSNLISRNVEKVLRYKPETVGLLHLFGSAAGQTAAVGVLPYQLGKIAYRMAKSSKLAKHYSKASAAAAAEDASTFNRELKILDQGLKKDEESDRWEYVD